MWINKFALVTGLAIASLLFLEVAAHADELNEASKLTFSAPIRIPGQVLPAGTYLFKLADSNNRNVVRIFNPNGTHLYATLQTISTERSEPTGETVVTLAEQPDKTAPALVNWFYPGSITGYEFTYPKQEEQQIAQARQQSIVAKDAAEAGD